MIPRSCRPAGLAGVLLAAALAPAGAQTTLSKSFFASDAPQEVVQAAVPAIACRGKLTQVSDLAYEGVRATKWNFAMTGGGGLGGRFDPTPVLSTGVTLRDGCLNAHFSAMVGSNLYGGVSNMTLFQLSLTPSTGGPLIALYGHYPTPYGAAAPAVASSAEYDVDTLGANFYVPVGSGAGQVPPGTYKLNVWWAGGPTAAGGAIGAAFTLKLYQP